MSSNAQQLVVSHSDSCDVAPDKRFREGDLARSDSNQSLLESPWAAESQASRVIGAVSGEAFSVVSMSPKKLAICALPFLIGKNNQWFRHARDGPFQRRGEIAGALVARRVLRTEAGVAADLFVRRVLVPDEVAGWIDADHHRTVDGFRVAPG